MAYDRRDLDGIGGWLLIFILTVGLFTPLRLFYAIFRFYSGPAAAKIGAISTSSSFRLTETVFLLLHVAAAGS
jgi:hypothetical protein